MISAVKSNVKDLVEAGLAIVRPTTDCPSEFLRVAFVAIFGVLLSPWRFFRFGRRAIRTNLFLMVLAVSSKLRKGEPIGLLREVIYRIDPNLICPSGGSPEGLVDHLIEFGAGVQISEELSRQFMMSRKDFSADLPELYCQLYDGEPVKIRTRSNGAKSTERPVFSLVGATTPDSFMKSFTLSNVLSGLGYRFFIAFAEESDVDRKPLPEVLDQKAFDGYVDEVRREYENFCKGREEEVHFDIDATALYLEIDQQLIGKYDDPRMGAAVERGLITVRKIACILAFARRRSTTVEASEIAEAAPIVEASLDTLQMLLDKIDEKDANDFIVKDAKLVFDQIKRLAPKYASAPYIPHSQLTPRCHLAAERFWPAALHCVQTGLVLPLPLNGRGMGWCLRPTFDSNTQTEKEREMSIEASSQILREYIEGLRFPSRLKKKVEPKS